MEIFFGLPKIIPDTPPESKRNQYLNMLKFFSPFSNRYLDNVLLQVIEIVLFEWGITKPIPLACLIQSFTCSVSAGNVQANPPPPRKFWASYPHLTEQGRPIQNLVGGLSPDFPIIFGGIIAPQNPNPLKPRFLDVSRVVSEKSF